MISPSDVNCIADRYLNNLYHKLKINQFNSENSARGYKISNLHFPTQMLEFIVCMTTSQLTTFD